MYRQRCLTSFHEPNGWFMLFPSRKSLAMYIACFGNTAYHAQSWTNASFLSLSPQIQSRVYNASLKSRLSSHVMSLVLRDCVVYN
jgi:hypothetical protein